MLRWRRHPTLAVLVRFVEGEVDRKDLRKLNAHFARCKRCEKELDFLVNLKRAAQEMAHPSPPAGLLEEILERREAGERVIPPTSPVPLPLRQRPIGALVALLALFAAGAVFLLSREAAAGASSLRIGSESLGAGQTLQLEFHAADHLAGEPHLRLRVIRRSTGDPPPREVLGAYVETELGRVRSGRFHGELFLPASAVYAAFAVGAHS